MLRESFVFLDKVGLETERRLWRSGVRNWEDFLPAGVLPGITGARKAIYKMQISQADEALAKQDYSYFVKQMPQGQLFRLYPHLRDEAVYLDIETSGYYGDVTVIGLYDGEETITMVRGHNLDKELLQRLLDRYKMIVTFNGASFDLPVISRYFGIRFPHVHIDMRHVCSRLGLSGGLKAIEQRLGISREAELDGVNGGDAVALWQAYRLTGDARHLELLVKYNEADVVNLKPLAERCIGELWKATRGDVHSLSSHVVPALAAENPSQNQADRAFLPAMMT